MEKLLNSTDAEYDKPQAAGVWNGSTAFVALCFVYAVVVYVQQHFVMTHELYYNTLGEQLTVERIDAVLKLRSRYEWMAFAMIPLTVFLQALLISICLSTGTILMDYKVPFRRVFGMVMKALTIFALGKVLYVMVLLLIDVQTMDDLIRADVFSLLGWIDKDGLPDWLLYPLGVLSVFEIIFWVLLAVGMGNLLWRPARQMPGFIAVTYGLGLLVWLALVVFLQLNLQ